MKTVKNISNTNVLGSRQVILFIGFEGVGMSWDAVQGCLGMSGDVFGMSLVVLGSLVVSWDVLRCLGCLRMSWDGVGCLSTSLAPKPPPVASKTHLNAHEMPPFASAAR